MTNLIEKTEGTVLCRMSLDSDGDDNGNATDVGKYLKFINIEYVCDFSLEWKVQQKMYQVKEHNLNSKAGSRKHLLLETSYDLKYRCHFWWFLIHSCKMFLVKDIFIQEVFRQEDFGYIHSKMASRCVKYQCTMCPPLITLLLEFAIISTVCFRYSLVIIAHSDLLTN